MRAQSEPTADAEASALSPSKGQHSIEEPAQEAPPTTPAVASINLKQRTAMDSAVQQFLTKGDFAQARSLIANWQPRGLDPPQTSYLIGMCDWYAGDLSSAESAFKQTLAEEREHPHALTYLGLVLEQQERISEALPFYQLRFAIDPHNEPIQIELARVLRKLGRSSEAEEVLPTPGTKQVSRELALEMAERTYAIGQYAEAVAWFTAADLEASHIAETLRTAASALALSDQYQESQQLFARVDEAQAVTRHSSELQRRLQIDPGDAKAQADLRQLSQDEPVAGYHSSGSTLYDTKCAACHGLFGAADGRAARFLFPRPRNFRTESFRMVSSVNAVAASSDIADTIRRGLPGTSMPAFGDLSEQQLLDLSELVLQFRRDGMREQLTSLESDEQADRAAQEARITELVTRRTTPSEPLAIPDMQTSPEGIDRGRLTFVQLGCVQCHGEPGSGPTQFRLYDEAGLPSVPRDLAQEFMKGGADTASLFKRIRLGMPGTAHPALQGTTEQIMDLVLFCRSLSQLPKQTTTNHQRYHRAMRGL